MFFLEREKNTVVFPKQALFLCWPLTPLRNINLINSQNRQKRGDQGCRGQYYILRFAALNFISPLAIPSCFHNFSPLAIPSCFQKNSPLAIPSCFHNFSPLAISPCFHNFSPLTIPSCFHNFSFQLAVQIYYTYCGHSLTRSLSLQNWEKTKISLIL